MEINKEIRTIFIEHKIPIQAGTLVLLGIYFNLDVDTVCPEEIIKAINITKIVEKDYKNNTIIWNIPLFEGQNTKWDWLEEWNNAFGRINPARQDNLSDVTKRMVEFFQKYHYGIQDVFRARDAYFLTVDNPKYLFRSAKFILEGNAPNKTSMLLTWCEKVIGSRSKDKDVI